MSKIFKTPSAIQVLQEDYDVDIAKRTKQYVLNKEKQRDINTKFGFTNKAEAVNGRIAMVAVLACLTVEYFTGMSFFDQIINIFKLFHG